MDGIIGSVLGWLGTAGTFSAYLMIWRGWMAPTAVLYGALNAVGGLLAGAGALAFGAWPAVISNLVWALLGLHGFVSGLLRRKREARGRLAGAPEEIVFDALPHLDDESILSAITRPLATVPAAPRRAQDAHHSMLALQ